MRLSLAPATYPTGLSTECGSAFMGPPMVPDGITRNGSEVAAEALRICEFVTRPCMRGSTYDRMRCHMCRTGPLGIDRFDDINTARMFLDRIEVTRGA